MIHRFQNIYGITYNISGDLKNFKDELQKLILSVLDDKKSPFTDVYVKIPIFLFQRFMDELRNSNICYKEMESRKEFFLIKF